MRQDLFTSDIDLAVSEFETQFKSFTFDRQFDEPRPTERQGVILEDRRYWSVVYVER